MQGIGQLLGKIENAPTKLLRLASDFFSGMQVKVVLEKTGIKLEFNRNRPTITDVIFTSLEKLHEIAKRKNKRVILFLDEFQVVGEVTTSHVIEAAIREAAQKSTHVAYVFSGSNRHLMEQLFYDRKRPLYKICDQIKLDRIHPEEYVKYILKASSQQWQRLILPETIKIILQITELHPYYVNKLCSLLWQGNQPPSENEVYITWNQFVSENKSTIERELDLLSINQRKLLIFLANGETSELFSRKVTQEINLTASSIQRALKPLMEKDYIFLGHKNSYKVLDPLIKSVLLN